LTNSIQRIWEIEDLLRERQKRLNADVTALEVALVRVRGELADIHNLSWLTFITLVGVLVGVQDMQQCIPPRF